MPFYVYFCVCVYVSDIYAMWKCAEKCSLINNTMCNYRYCYHVVEDGRWSRLAPE